MGVLCVFLAFVEDGLLGQIRAAVDIGYVSSHHLHRVIGDAGRIAAHVGDQTDASFIAELDTFVEALRQHHRFFDGKAEAASGVLLQFARCERRHGIPFLFFRDDRLDKELGVLHYIENMIRFRLLLNISGFAFYFGKTRFEPGRFVAFELCDDRPILFWNERQDFALALHDQAHRDRLHPAGGDPAPHFIPQQRADLIAHKPV